MDFKISINDKTIVDKISILDKITITINIEEKEYIIKIENINSDSNRNIQRKDKSESERFIDDILDKINEPNDKFMKMDDKELIKTVSKLLEMSNKLNISEYYKKKYNESLQFNLRGLVLNNTIRYNSDSARKKIRDLGRKCIEFLEIKQNETSCNLPNQTMDKIKISQEINTQLNQRIEPSAKILKSREINIQPTPDLIKKEEQIDNSGYIYVIREREFVNMNQNVYKIGRTDNFLRRFSQYPKNSEIIFVNKINNQCKIETKLIRKLKQKFKHRKDIGNEYFEAEKDALLDIVKQITKDQ